MTEIGVSTDFTSTVSDSSQNVATQAAATSQSCNSYKNTSFAASGSGAQAVLAAAQSQLGVPYVFGGGDLNGPTHGGFDCSGFTRYAFNKAGVSLPRTAADQWHATQQYQVAVGQEQPGDLVFFVTVGSFTDPGHVGIVLDPGKKLMMAEPKTGDVAKIQSYAWGSIVGFTRPYPSATAPSANG
jgi:cell wall-associated NlpC family hydrolase